MAPAQAPPSLAEAVLLLLLLSRALLLPVALAVALVLLPAKELLVLTAHASVLLPAVLVLSLMLRPKVSVPLAEWEVSIYKSPRLVFIYPVADLTIQALFPSAWVPCKRALILRNR